MTPENKTFERVEPRVSLPKMEEAVLARWRETDAFRISVESRPVDNEYVFYDGPPFPTGAPHYGNLLAGIVKDMVPRYWTMRGYRVERRFGWDTHGLPIEMEVEKKLGISGPAEIEGYGIDRFNEACRLTVQANTESWEVLTERIGRWIDFRNDYRTMDPEFMETVWWVFKQLWDKDLVYKDFKVLPYSWGAATPLSNFEAGLDYQDVEDPSITVRLGTQDWDGLVEAGDFLLIWTTTPWTLPANLAVSVGEGFEYSRVLCDGAHYWLASERIEEVLGENVEVLSTVNGSQLVGLSYQPPFDYFAAERDRGAFRVIASDDVTVEDGTGLVHVAPAYGEADFIALQNAGLDTLVDPVDAEGRFTNEVPDVAGVNIKKADAALIELLRESSKLVKSERITHPYPYCYRTSTPLIYKAIPTWFVGVESLRDRMVELNEQVHWVPEHVGSRRFGNWLAGARDWAISRNRYWGSCIPVWECTGCDETVAVGSLDEVEALSGQRPNDLHKDVMDGVTWACSACSGVMARVPEVLDCWFESGSMPYGKLHYPFQNKDRFEATYPAQFIAEGLDQTRGWFYTLVVLSTALVDKPAFENCVVSGLILAEDGRKMSKSLKNYPDPSEILNEYGADAVRAFLVNSPVLRAEPLRFTKKGVSEVVRSVLLPLWNTYSFFTTYAEADGITLNDLAAAPEPTDRPEIDRWILSILQSLVEQVNTEMEGYYLYNVVPATLGFVDHLTNWYVRRSRRRFWRVRSGDAEDQDKLAAFATLYEVINRFIEVLAPLLPFITEHIYQDLVVRHDAGAPSSVHHRDFPVADAALIDAALETDMATVREVVRLGRNLRKREGCRVRQPLRRLTVFTRDTRVRAAVESHQGIISDELNVKEVTVSANERELIVLTAKANYGRLGPSLSAKMSEAADAVEGLTTEQIEKLLDGGEIDLGVTTIGIDDVIVETTARDGTVVETGPSFAAALDTEISRDLMLEGLAREIVSKVQAERRAQNLHVADRIRLWWSSDDADVVTAMTLFSDVIATEVLAASVTNDERADLVRPIDDRSLSISITRD